MQRLRPVMLLILDGWGWREEAADNAVRLAQAPTFDNLWDTCPHALLHASGADVGLPEGQMGNSEVGHLNIGAGRIVKGDLLRISEAIADGTMTQGAGAANVDRASAAEWRRMPSAGAGFAWRRAFTSESCRRPREDPCRGGCIDGCPRLYGWP